MRTELNYYEQNSQTASTIKVLYFRKICYRIQFEDSALSNASVKPTSQIPALNMFIITDCWTLKTGMLVGRGGSDGKHTNTQHVDIVSTFSVTKGKQAKTGDKTPSPDYPKKRHLPVLNKILLNNLRSRITPHVDRM
jgi:hypothetical protein